jgi:FK506-binding protein 2
MMFLITGIAFVYAVSRFDLQDDMAKNAPLKTEILNPITEENCKSKASPGSKVSVHYTGWLLKTGKEFDSSVARNKPFEFKLGAGQVIKGWDEGVQGMCIGEKRRLFIPSGLGYGDRGAGGLIPPGASLVFDVELIGVKKSKKEL